MQDDFLDWLRTGVALQGGLAVDAFARMGGRELAPGERLGPFAVTGEIGRGGMAIVYAARRADGEFEQQVAIKWMPGGAQGETAAVLFRRERQILAELRHPHIARLLDGGRTGDGMLWFAMERVEGLRLDHHLATGAAPGLHERLALFGQVCAALGFAHGRGLVHRDIKPANIAVDADGSVKLLDFGVALLAEQDPDSLRHAYTPGWASPEQVRGETTGPASDIHQLGLLLRWLLAATDDRPAPTGLPADGSGRHRQMAAIVARALSERPEQRQASVAELQRELAAWQQYRPVPGYDCGWPSRIALFLRRNTAASVLALLALIVLLVLSSGFAWRLARERDLALVQAQRADAARDFLVSLFRGADPTANKGLAMSARELLDLGEARIATELADQPLLRGDLQEAVASIYNFLAEHERAQALAVAALAATDPDDPAQALARGRRLLLLANIHARASRAELALEHSSAALAAIAGIDNPAALELELGALNVQAMAFKRLERGAEAAAVLERVLARVDASPEAQAHRAYAADNLAHLYEVQGHWQRARTQAAVAEQAFLALRGPDHPEPWAVAAYRANLDYASGDLAAAHARYADVLVAQQRLYADDDRRLMNTRTSLARVALRQGQLDLAESMVSQAIEQCQRQFGPGHGECPLTLQVWAEVQVQRQRLDIGLPALRESVRLRAGIDNPVHRGLGLAQLALASALCRHDATEEGRPVLAQARGNLQVTPPAPLDQQLLAETEAACGG